MVKNKYLFPLIDTDIMLKAHLKRMSVLWNLHGIYFLSSTLYCGTSECQHHTGASHMDEYVII